MSKLSKNFGINYLSDYLKFNIYIHTHTLIQYSLCLHFHAFKYVLFVAGKYNIRK